MSVKGLKNRLRGIDVLMVTPFKPDTMELDVEGLRKITRFVIESGIKEGNGFLTVVPSDGEMTNMHEEEIKKAFKVVVDEAKGKIPVLANCTHTSTDITIELGKYAKDTGADGLMIGAPYYWVPTEEVILKHFEKIVNELKEIGIMVYNNQFASQIDISVEIMDKLADIDNVVSFKETTISFSKYNRMIKVLGDRVSFINGWGEGFEPFASLMGSKGWSSDFACFAPKLVLELYQAIEKKNFLQAKETHSKLTLFYESKAVSKRDQRISYIKEAINMIGLPGGVTRMPLLPITDEEKGELRDFLESINLL